MKATKIHIVSFLILFFHSFGLHSQSLPQPLYTYGKDSIKAYHVKSIKEYLDDRIEYLYEYNKNGNLTHHVVYSYFGDPFIIQDKRYNARGELTEEHRSHQQERYDQHTLYYNDKTGLHVKEQRNYLKPDSNRTEVSIQRKDGKGRIRSEETYKIIKDRQGEIKTIEDSIRYEYFDNDTLKSRKEYSDQMVYSYESYNASGKPLEKIRYRNTKEVKRTIWKYLLDTLLLEKSDYEYESGYTSHETNTYNDAHKLVKSFFYDSKVQFETMTYEATFDKAGRIVQSISYDPSSGQVYKTLYKYSGRKQKVLLFKQHKHADPSSFVQTKETVLDKSGRKLSVTILGYGKVIRKTEWKYNRNGMLHEEWYTGEDGKRRLAEQWKYDKQGRVISYSKNNLNMHSHGSTHYDKKEETCLYDLQGHMVKRSECIFEKDTVCIEWETTYDQSGRVIEEKKQQNGRDLLKKRYEYDAQGLLIRFEHDQLKREYSLTTYSYTAQRLLSEQSDKDRSGAVVQKIRYVYEFYE